MEPGALRELGQDVAQAMDRAALPVRVGPQLTDGHDKAGRAVADHQQGCAQAPAQEAPAQVELVLGALASAEADVEQDAVPIGGVAPGHEHALLGSLGTDGQVDGISDERQEADLGEAPGAEG